MVPSARLAIIGFLWFAIHSSGLAQQPRPGMYLDGLVASEKRVEQMEHGATADDKAGVWPALQFLAFAQAFAGDTDAAMASYDRGLRAFRPAVAHMPVDDIVRMEGEYVYSTEQD